MDRLAIITPSYINSERRFQLARDSLASLRGAIDQNQRHVVVDDLAPGTLLLPDFIRTRLSPWRWNGRAEGLYAADNVVRIPRSKGGSASALADALQAAKSAGFDLVFIHLDDHVYVPKCRELLEYACDAFDHDRQLKVVRLSGYPILYDGPRILRLEQDRVLFDQVVLTPTRLPRYTLWSAPFEKCSIDGTFWPIILWFCMYHVEYLEHLMSSAGIRPSQPLGAVELHYRRRENWLTHVNNHPGRFGFINMQFGGLEMHRNANWRALISRDNPEIR